MSTAKKDKLMKILSVMSAVFKAGLGIGIFIAIQLLLSLVYIFLNIDYEVYQGVYALAYSVVTAVVLYLFIRYESRDYKSFFLNNKPDTSPILVVIVIAISMLGIVTAYMLIVNAISTYLDSFKTAIEEYREGVDRYANVDKKAVPLWDSILYLIAIVFTVPICEELLFRGIVCGEFRKVTNKKVAIVVSALVFGLMHGLSVQIGYAFICGLIMAYVYETTGSIRYSVIMHMIFNLFGSALIYFLELDQLGIPNNIVREISTRVTLIEIFAITPGILSLVFLWYMKKMGKFGNTNEQT